jgi:hypothetical protein
LPGLRLKIGATSCSTRQEFSSMFVFSSLETH